mgnify:CR=1 FL=1
MRPEPSHAAGQAAFHAALWQAEPPPGLTAPDPAEIARRFAVYRNNVRHGLIRALAAAFPVVEALLGAEFHAAMAQVYIRRFPPRGPVLQEWGADFPDFLDRFAPVAHLPWLGDVARLELARGRACHAADAAPVAPAALAVADPGALRLTLHPSVALFASVHPAVGIWLRHQPGAAAVPLVPGPGHALIGRQPDFTVVVIPVGAGTHAVLRALAEGATLGSAATAADPTEALTLLLRHGLIIATATGDPS